MLCFKCLVQIRRSAIKELPNICKENTDHLLRIADVLAQLLQSDDPHEVTIVNSALMSLFKIDMKGEQCGPTQSVTTKRLDINIRGGTF